MVDSKVFQRLKMYSLQRASLVAQWQSAYLPVQAMQVQSLGRGRVESPGEGNGNVGPPVFLPETSHGQGSLAGYSPWDQKESARI